MSWAAINAFTGRMRPAGREFETPALYPVNQNICGVKCGKGIGDTLEIKHALSLF